MLDNLRVPKAPTVAQAVASFGARLLFLPPYSPDFTPVELAFSKLKTGLRTAQAQVYNAVGALVATLHSAPTTAGQDYYLSLPAEKLSSGVYFCRLTSAGHTKTRRFVVQH